MTESTVLVTGATGRTGRRVVRRLRDRGLAVRPASRSGRTPFDWYDDRTWDAALRGCRAAYVCFSPDLALPGVDGIVEDFTGAALARGVRRLVLLSGRGEEGAQRCEQIVLHAAADATVVRCSWFQENFSEHFLRDGVLAGRIAVPAGSVTEPFVSLQDVADVAALALAGGRMPDRIVELTGPESIGFGRATHLLSMTLGREIVYEAVTAEAFVTELTAVGVDRTDAQGLAWLFEEVLDGRNSGTTGTVERVLGRPATTFEEYARRVAASGVLSTRPETPVADASRDARAGIAVGLV